MQDDREAQDPTEASRRESWWTTRVEPYLLEWDISNVVVVVVGSGEVGGMSVGTSVLVVSTGRLTDVMLRCSLTNAEFLGVRMLYVFEFNERRDGSVEGATEDLYISDSLASSKVGDKTALSS